MYHKLKNTAHPCHPLAHWWHASLSKTHHLQRASWQIFRYTCHCCKDQEHKFLCSVVCQTTCSLIPLCSQVAKERLESVLHWAASGQPSPGLPSDQHWNKAPTMRYIFHTHRVWTMWHGDRFCMQLLSVFRWWRFCLVYTGVSCAVH